MGLHKTWKISDDAVEKATKKYQLKAIHTEIRIYKYGMFSGRILRQRERICVCEVRKETEKIC